MNYNLRKVINERLKNRLEWLSYLDWLITHRKLHKTAMDRFYRDKPLLNLILKLYFLPYNTLKYITFAMDQHKYEMILKEVELLKYIKNKQQKDLE